MTKRDLTSDWELFKEFSVRTLDAKSSVGVGVLGVYTTHDTHSRHVFCNPSKEEVWGTSIIGGAGDAQTLPRDDLLAWFDFLRGS